jgi:hypothetical protein
MACISKVAIPAKRGTKYEAYPLIPASTDTAKIIGRMERDFLFANVAILPALPQRKGQ